MRFYYQNSIGDAGYFFENDLIKAIYTAWNVESELYLLTNGADRINWQETLSEQCKIVFIPWENNEYNSEKLKEFGYKIVDLGNEREIVDINTGKVIKYDWSEVKQLI
jgi:hypothetical protein